MRLGDRHFAAETDGQAGELREIQVSTAGDSQTKPGELDGTEVPAIGEFGTVAELRHNPMEIDDEGPERRRRLLREQQPRKAEDQQCGADAQC